ncbi:LysR family transcriptional regulator [Rhodobacter aestuarii]|uniref:Transcriptional regulator, LysR family n=1 Tax=Rhodobacter aestuarii TaxID=453582 RepID=A0A1N7LI74_9RHOB|nr:LysR family transcriptional regulator [Rhodobacter aestuarii]PTV95239.1 LysR family transcriptional regulator [Rhodobacter aestuarii]SIS73499.1 transcriptional regulator, LysR family [Rhodobacter aestuarii]
MSLPRRYTPSVSLLSAFEAVVRTGSTAAAARELSLTQGAVSRLVQNLEGQLGVQLFRREGRRLVPTEAAQSYARDVRKALELIARASLGLRANPGGGVLNLAILPTFGTRWLAPRLADFLAEHPGVTLNLGTRMRPFDFASESFDAAIHFGTRPWPDADHLLLFEERLIATCSADYARENHLKQPEDLLNQSLLQLESRPNAWNAWCAHHGLSAPAQRGIMFDQFAPMMQAAAHGVGLALLPEFLAKPEIAEGRLVAAPGEIVSGVGAYHLVWPVGVTPSPALVAFRDWITCAAAQ